jgi:hypothetical protein
MNDYLAEEGNCRTNDSNERRWAGKLSQLSRSRSRDRRGYAGSSSACSTVNRARGLGNFRGNNSVAFIFGGNGRRRAAHRDSCVNPWRVDTGWVGGLCSKALGACTWAIYRWGCGNACLAGSSRACVGDPRGDALSCAGAAVLCQDKNVRKWAMMIPTRWAEQRWSRQERDRLRCHKQRLGLHGCCFYKKRS